MMFLNQSEYIKKYYGKQKFKKKQQALTDYYKFHIEIPRVYMMPLSEICNCTFNLVSFPRPKTSHKLLQGKKSFAPATGKLRTDGNHPRGDFRVESVFGTLLNQFPNVQIPQIQTPQELSEGQCPQIHCQRHSPGNSLFSTESELHQFEGN